MKIFIIIALIYFNIKFLANGIIFIFAVADDDKDKSIPAMINTCISIMWIIGAIIALCVG